MSSLEGQSIGRYHIIEALGEGGMAAVYKAYDTRLEREVAVKFIRCESSNPDVLARMLKRFEREAKALAKLIHPNIVSVIDYGEQEGTPYLVMPYLPGGTLKERTGASMPYPQAAQLLYPVARALQFAHSEGILHRDVKPSNILISKSGEPMLGDFGVARLLEGEKGSTLTGTGVGVGTPEYMAPEQARGLALDGRADVYALGIVFYELITGRRPFEADTPLAVAIKQAADPLPRPREFVPGLPDEVEKVLFKALAKKPEDRYADMAAFATALEQLERAPIPGERSRTSLKKSSPQAQPPPRKAKPSSKETYDDLRPEVEAPQPAPQPANLAAKAPGRQAKPWLLVGGIALVILAVFIGGTILVSGWIKQGTEKGAGPLSFLATRTPTLTLTPSSTSTPRRTATPILTFTASATPNPQVALPTTLTSPPQAGDTQVSAIDGMVMVYVPEGEFLMGSASSDAQAPSDEKPQHTVYLDSFWIDRTEVTNAMYAKCVAAGDCDPPRDTSSSTRSTYYGNTQFANSPVIYVDWNDASAYCQWVGRRLPSEAEWEKAARGTDGRIYPWGNQAATCNLANYWVGNTGCVGDTSQVGSYPDGASPYGALDMAGNVLEWANDWYDANYYSISPSANPSGPSSGQYHALRGGAWSSDGWFVRTADRDRNSSDYPYYNFGFRCLLSP
jgi:eukaryotic-like serine/threonine-protein kinase